MCDRGGQRSADRLPVKTPSGMPTIVASASAVTPSSAVLPARSRISAATGRRNLQGLAEIKSHDCERASRRIARRAACRNQDDVVRPRESARFVPNASSGGASRASSSEADETTKTSRTAKPRRRSRVSPERASHSVDVSAGTAARLTASAQRRAGHAANESALQSSCGICGAGCGLTTRVLTASVTLGVTR